MRTRQPFIKASPVPCWWMVMAAGCLLLCAKAVAAGGHSWLYRAWQTDDGLPNNDVTMIAQALDGSMIIATQGGVSRLDGLRLRAIDEDSDARGVLVTRDGAFWQFGRSALLGVKDGRTVLRKHITPLPTDLRVTAFFEHQDGSLWLSTDIGPLLRVANGKVKAMGLSVSGKPSSFSMAAADGSGEVFAVAPGMLTRFKDDHFEQIAALPPESARVCAAKAGGLWIGTALEVLRYTAEKGVVPVGTLPAPPSGVRISAIMEDRGGRLWVGTYGSGLFVLENDHFEKVMLANHDVWSLMEDREGNIWASTGGGGACRVRPRVLELLSDEGAPVEQTARALCTDTRGDIWVALQTGRLYLKRAGVWKALAPQVDWPAHLATTVAADEAGNVWIATSEGDLIRWNGQAYDRIPLPEAKAGQTRVRALLTAPDGQVWVGRGDTLLSGTAAGWTSRRLQEGGDEIQVLGRDTGGVIWAGTRRGRLLKVDGENLAPLAAPELSNSGSIRAILGAADGSLWVGLAGGGVGRLKDGKFRVVTKKQGLWHDEVSQLAMDSLNRLWCGGDLGIFVVPVTALDDVMEGRSKLLFCTGYGRSENVQSLQANSGYSPNSMLGPSGRLWFATRSGIASVDPSIAGGNTQAPPVSIESMQVDGRHVAAEAGARIGPGVRSVRFEFGAMSFTAPENVAMLHRLDGVDDDWVKTSQDRTANYSPLPPGNYTLRVRAANNDGVWNTQGAVLAFTVLPFFWQTIWFRLLLVVLLVALTAGIVFLILQARYLRKTEALQREAALQAERTRIARDMHDQLGASLTQISMLSDLAVAQGAGGPQLPKLAATARHAVTALDEIVWAVDPSQDNLGGLLEYLSQQTAELVQTAGLRCRLDLPANPTDRPLSAEFRHHLFLIVREAVNNAIKHAEASEIRLTITVGGDLRVIIADNGKGLGASQGSGYGLKNLERRAMELAGRCVIHSESGKGSIVEIVVPWPV